MKIRSPAVAGYFYPKDPIRLREQIQQYLIPKAQATKAIAAVCPHAGYMYSGAVAGAVYSHLIIPENVILIGPNHTGIGAKASIMTEGIWETPLGEVKVNTEIALEVLKHSKFLREDTMAHLSEHSLEVQLPFIQYFYPEVKITPIVIMATSYEICEDIGEAIAKAIDRKKALIIASTDMTHYESQEKAAQKDKLAIDAILELNPKKLYEVVFSNKISMCGVIPTTCALIAACKLGASEAQLIRYMTSGDVTGDYSQVVGYAGVIIH